MKFYPLAIVILLAGFSVMSFNPVYKGVKTENTAINKGLTDFKDKLEQLKSDVRRFSEDSISLNELRKPKPCKAPETETFPGIRLMI